MEQALSINEMVDEQDQQISETIVREQARLRNFIRRRVPDWGDVEDILQDVFSELVEAYRLMEPIEQVGAWLFRVARNRARSYVFLISPRKTEISHQPRSETKTGKQGQVAAALRVRAASQLKRHLLPGFLADRRWRLEFD